MQGSNDRTSRAAGGKKAAKALTGALAGALVGACLLAPGGADAYEQYSIREGGNDKFRYTLPLFPFEARRVNRGYSGVRYKLCTSDGTAKGHVWGVGGPSDADYLGICGLPMEFISTGRYSKHIDLKPMTMDDKLKEGDEHFWIKFSNPEVRAWGSNTWKSHSGNRHVPSQIWIRVNIKDND